MIITLLFLFILASSLPIINGIEANYDLKTTEQNLYENNLANSEWRQLIGGENAGFGKNTNIGLKKISADIEKDLEEVKAVGIKEFIAIPHMN